MCKSVETSLITFASTLVITTWVWSNTNKSQGIYRFPAVFILVVSLMQLIDALLWISIESKNIWLNRIASTYLIPLVLSLELLISYYGIKYYFGWSNQWFEIILWISIIILLYRWIPSCKETVIYSDGYLLWCDKFMSNIGRLGFLAILTIPIIVAYPNIFIKWLILGSIYFLFIINFMKGTFGTRWCWMGNFVAPLLLISLFIEKLSKNKNLY